MRYFLISILLILAGCSRHLDLQPKMHISASDAFGSEENIEAALMGCYDALQQENYYGRNLIIVGDLLSDNSIAKGTKIEYYSADANALLTDNLLVEGIWAAIYSALNRVNYMLYKLDGNNITDTLTANNYKGQLCFLRALHYFNLVRLYGEVPLKISPTLNDDDENYLPRSPVSAVYDQIVTDLLFAIENIENRKTFLANNLAATSLLASVYLTMGDFNKALEYAENALAENAFLEPDYDELFSNSIEPSDEILFYIPFSADDKNRLAEYHYPYQLGGRHENAPSATLIEKIEERDHRKNLIAATYNNQFYTTKYADLSTGTDKVIVLRNAEVCFIRMEAYYFIDSAGYENQILSDINLIRNRAGLLPVSNDSTSSLWELIEREKQLEFAFEGKRWFDLIRTQRAVDIIQTVTDPYQMLFPIPLSEILSNPRITMADQNEGY